MSHDTPTPAPSAPRDSAPRPACLACDQDSDATPLICLEYRGEPLWICPQHMPLLIHQPERLVGRLAGAAPRAKPSV